MNDVIKRTVTVVAGWVNVAKSSLANETWSSFDVGFENYADYLEQTKCELEKAESKTGDLLTSLANVTLYGQEIVDVRNLMN